jgi:hypothetical protein
VERLRYSATTTKQGAVKEANNKTLRWDKMILALS